MIDWFELERKELIEIDAGEINFAVKYKTKLSTTLEIRRSYVRNCQGVKNGINIRRTRKINIKILHFR